MTKKISALTAASTPLTGAELIEIVQSGTSKQATTADIAGLAPFVLIVAASDESTALTTGTAKITFPWPADVTLSDVSAFVGDEQASGSILTVDVNQSGTSILSTKLTIDNGENSSTTAVAARVISNPDMTAGAAVTIDIDQVGDGTAKGLKVTFIGVYA